jgi:tRNA (adenine22-N1)-methyltransferase
MSGLSKRLTAVAELVEQGSAIVDIGTDHGYVPVYLVKNGIAKSAVALDINEGPLASCRALVESEGLSDRISVRLSDGLENVKSEEYDTVIIAGMGGELISDILSRCRDAEKKHLILQPMTHPEIARKYLYDNGYGILHDFTVADGRHHYSVFDARFTGDFRERSRADYYLGEISDFSDKEYFLHLLNYLRNKVKSGEDNDDVIAAVEKIL